MTGVCVVRRVDPEVLSRGGELRDTKGVGSGEGQCPLPRKFLNLKSKNDVL